jgi:AbrB family looped-hinge helix DNA binding protein
MNASRMTSKGQVTIPRELREGLGLQPGDEVRFVATPEGIRIEKWIPGSPFADYRGFLTHLRGTGVDQLIDDLRGPVEL